MTTETDRSAATDHQLNVWRQRLKEGHALPVLLLGLGIDHRSGQCVACVTDEVPLPQLLHLLKQAVAMIEEKMR